MPVNNEVMALARVLSCLIVEQRANDAPLMVI